jgi:hypothetical protein
MANITPQQLFPSAKFISTKANGDLKEVHPIDAIKASLSVESLFIEATNGGDAGNSITFEVQDSGRTTGNIANFSVTGTDVVADVRLNANSSIPSSSQIATSFNDNAPQDVKDLISVTILGGITATTMSSLTHASQSLTGGADAITGQDLDGTSTYLLIKTDDIADLETSEQSDGRKVMYGLIDKANEAFSALSDAPSNLKISTSNPIYNSSTNTIFKSYLVETFLSFQGLDVKDES